MDFTVARRDGARFRKEVKPTPIAYWLLPGFLTMPHRS
jgi:hypothetical protein